MRGVARRATSVLALLDARAAWPHAELGTLTNFLRSTVLRRPVFDEDTLLDPHDVSAPRFAELSAHYLRLHALTAKLERAYVQPCPSTQLRALVDDLLSALQRHHADAQRMLAAIPDIDTLVGVWLDEYPDQEAVGLCVDGVPAAAGHPG